jgi:prevent-host-death family protein
MQRWSSTQAKNRFGSMLDECIAHGPQLITRCGRECAVMLSIEEWRRLQTAAPRSLKQLLLDDGARWSVDLPARGRLRRRMPLADR